MAIDKIQDRATNITTTIDGLDDATVSNTDPTKTTNPSSGVGTLWLNSTSGEVYVCTNATTNSNIWKNIGDGSGGLDFPDATGITSNPSDLSAITISTTQNITFTNATDTKDSVFDFAITNISSAERKLGLNKINLIENEIWKDLFQPDLKIDKLKVLKLSPFQTVWISN